MRAEMYIFLKKLKKIKNAPFKVRSFCKHQSKSKIGLKTAKILFSLQIFFTLELTTRILSGELLKYS